MNEDYVGRTRTYGELKQLSKADLIAAHDAMTRNAIGSVDYFRRELVYREQEEQTRAMLRLTQRMERLTWFIAALTAANVVAVVIQVIDALSR